MKTYTGKCHCGAVQYEVEADLEKDTVLQCNCSHCSVKGFLLDFVPAAHFKILSGEDNLTEYRFNKKVIAHRFCKTCGVQCFALAKNEKGEDTVAVNVRTLEGVDVSKLSPTPFNGRDLM
jgi:hypothetical protein